jgi:hypothetical protein
MKTLAFVMSIAILLVGAQFAFAQRSGAQVGAEQAQLGAPEIAGDGIQNATQDEEYGHSGDGESPNELSGDGIPNNAQDEEYGQYSEASTSVDSDPWFIQEKTQTQSMGEGQQIQVREQVIWNAEGSDAFMQAEQTRLREESKSYDGEAQKVFQNQEQMRIAVQAVLASSEAMGDQGYQAVQLGGAMQAKVQEALDVETKLKERSSVGKFFFGTNEEDAQQALAVAEEMQQQIRNMEQLVMTCESCDGDTKVVLQEQIQVMQQEQNRLEDLAQNESGKQGLFGFLFGWLR